LPPTPYEYLDRVYEVLGYRGRPFLKHAWREIIEHEIVVVEAPTGYGKTTLSQAFTLYSLDTGFKTTISYPLRTLLEDQYKKFTELMRRLGYRDLVGTRYMHHRDSYYFVKPVTLTTVDTLSMTLFGLEPSDLDKVIGGIYGSITHTLGHYLFARATTLLSNLVLDEVHLLADTTRSLNFLASLILIAYQNGCRLLLESATLPESYLETLRRIHSGIHVVRFNESIDPEFIEERESKEINYEKPSKINDSDSKYKQIIEWLRLARKEIGSKGFRALIVFNTVSEAIEMYDQLIKTEFKDIDIYLLHSRFRESDRRSKIMELKHKMELLKESLDKKIQSSINYIVIATQVIEAGVDITSNVFITDIAPANSLIQRLGRFLRYPGEKYGFLRIWYEDAIDETYKVYDGGLVKNTLDQLNCIGNKFNPHIPRAYRRLINNVYSIKDYRVDYSEVMDFIGLTLSLTSPHNAVKKFLELGGSFIRDTLLIPVTTEDIVKEGNPLEAIIPLSSMNLRRKAIVGKLVRDKDGEYRVSEVTKEELRNILKLSLSEDFIALVIRGRYDPIKGLILGDK